MRLLFSGSWLSMLLLVAGCASAPTPRTGAAPIEERGTHAPTPTARPSAASAKPAPLAPPATAAPLELGAERLPPAAVAASPAAPKPSSPPAGVNPAVVALLATAQGHQQSGNIEAAAATLERALSIDPQNASLWHQLADLRLRQAQFPQAAQLAAKSNLYATGNRTLQASNWRIIALAKEGAGDASGAREAYQRADALEAGQP